MPDLLNENGIVNKVATFAVLGILGWLAITVQQLDKRVAVMGANIDSLELTVRAGTADRYTATQARLEGSQQDSRIERLEREITAIRNKQERLEDDGDRGRP